MPSQIEVTLITARSEPYIESLVDSFANELDLQHLRKVNALIVTNSNSLMEDTANVGNEGSWDDHMTLRESHMSEGMSDLGKFMN